MEIFKNATFRLIAGFIVGFVFAYIILVPMAKAESFQIPPTTKSRMNDFANVLTPDQIKIIETNLYKIQNGYSTRPEFVVVTVPNLDGTSLEEISQSVFAKWKVGRKDLNNGIVLVIAKEGERRIRIQTGYGLEPYITDLLTSEVIRDTQRFIAINDYYMAISNVIMNKSIHAGFVKFGEDNPVTKVDVNKKSNGPLLFFVFSFLAIVILFIYRSNRKTHNDKSDVKRSYTPEYKPSSPYTSPRTTSYQSSSTTATSPNSRSNRNDDDSFTSGFVAGAIADIVIHSITNSASSDSSSSSNDSYDSYSGGGGDSGGGGSSD